MMDLQEFLIDKFQSWKPSAPEVILRGKGDITLDWKQKQFGFLEDHLLYRIEKNNKLPKWVVVYSGGKTQKRIDNLPSGYPHKFKLKVILQTTSVPKLADLAKAYYESEEKVYEEFENYERSKETDNANQNLNSTLFDNIKDKPEGDKPDIIDNDNNANGDQVSKDVNEETNNVQKESKVTERGDGYIEKILDGEKVPWLESQWSEEIWTNTDTIGSSAVCFCMAVKCGYLKQIQSMYEERPELIGLVNTRNGFTPLATAVIKGDMNMIRCLLGLGAEVDQVSAAGQTPLHFATLSGDTQRVQLLIEKGADLQIQDWNGLRVEHYAVDSGSVEMLKMILDLGGSVHARDHNGWTPLFRALCQGGRTEMVQELVDRGSDVDVVDYAGLPLSSVARLVRNRHGMPRESVIRLVDTNYPLEKVRAQFTRVSKKIHHLHTMLNLL